MRIRMKIKHLLITFVGMASVATMLILLVVPNLNNTEAKDSDNQDLFNRLEKETISDQKKWELIEKEIISELNVKLFDVYKSPSGTEYKYAYNPSKKEIYYVNQYIDEVPIEKKRSPQNGYYTRAIEELATYYQKKSEWKKAIQVLAEGMESITEQDQDYENLYTKQLEIKAMHIPEEAWEEASNLKPYKFSGRNYSRIVSVRVDLLMAESKLEEAYQTLKNGMEYVKTNTAWSSENLENRMDRLKAWKQGGDTYTYQGTIETKDGEPIKHAAIYLIHSQDIGSSMSRRFSPQAVTDQEGRFSIKAVPEGDYQVMLGVTLEQINGYTWPVEPDDWLELRSDYTDNITLQPVMNIKSPVNNKMVKGESITFEWEPVKNADSYRLYLGMEFESSGHSSKAKSGIEGSSVTISKQALFHKAFGYSFQQNDNDEMEVIPESILGLSNPNVDVFWYVKAYDEDGDLLTSSNGFRLTRDQATNIPYFQQKDQKLTEADRLVLEGKLDEAMAQYKRNIEEDPNDLHSYRVMYRILSSDRDLRKENAQIRMNYLKKLAEATGFSQYWYQLQQEAYKEGDWEKYFDYVQKSHEDPEDWSTYAFGNYAVALMKSGELSKAESYFQKSLEEDGRNRFMPSYVILKLYQNKSFNEAISIAEQFPERGYSQHNWAGRLQSIQEMANRSEDNKANFQEGLEKYMTLGARPFSEWVETIENEQLKQFFEDLE